jgi:ribosomal protein S12 methylthiotransferase
MKNAKNYYLVSLGCAKNTVDSESMAALLEGAGYRGVEQPSKASILIVNTCGFLKPAIQESLETLQGLAHRKRPGQLLIATGCLSERYRDRVAQEVPGVDGILGTRRWMDIVDVIHTLRTEKPPAVLYHLPDAPTVGKDEHGVLRAAIQGGSRRH